MLRDSWEIVEFAFGTQDVEANSEGQDWKQQLGEIALYMANIIWYMHYTIGQEPALFYAEMGDVFLSVHFARVPELMLDDAMLYV